MKHLWVCLCSLFAATFAAAEPTLDEILAGCQYLSPGDVPAGAVEQPLLAVYVATAADGGSDANAGTSIDHPFATLDHALAYAETHASTPLAIYLRRGEHYFKEADPDFAITRGHLVIASLPGEFATVRPYYWPDDPHSYGEERAFVLSGSAESIRFESLVLEGWGVGFELASPVDSPPLRDVTLRNVLARNFRHRDGNPDFRSVFLETGYLDSDVYGPGKQIFDSPETAHYQVENLLLSNVTVEGADLGINAGDENDANLRGVRLTHFNFHRDPGGSGDTADDAVALVNCYKILIDHSRIVNAMGDGLDAKSYDVSLVNSYVEGAGRNAVKFWRNGELINTILYRNTPINDGALVSEQGPLRMIHSVILDSSIGYAGTFNYDATGSARCEIVNSVFGKVRSFYAGTDQLVALSNRFAEIGPGVPLLDGQSFAADAVALNARPGCAGNAVSALEFVAPQTGNFRTVPGADWVDAGTGAGVLLPSFDYYGRPRSEGGGPDVGPAEFQLATPTPTPTPSPTPTASVTITPTPTYGILSATAARMLYDAGADVLFVDVREDSEYRGGHIPGALNLPWNTSVLQGNHAALPPRMVIAYDQRGSRGAASAQFLVNHGHANIYNLAGGLDAWLALPAPVRPPGDYSFNDTVDAVDLILLLRVRPDPLLDLTDDFLFDYRDVFQFALSWGRVYRPLLE